jgi:uncharacterized protein YjbJ (UPF0337 family)
VLHHYGGLKRPAAATACDIRLIRWRPPAELGINLGVNQLHRATPSIIQRGICHMTHDENAATQAREGLAAAIAGKVKEAAGAVLGNDSLAREGQLQQSEAQARREANAEEAIADAEAAQAAAKLRAEDEVAEQARQDAADAEARRVRDAELDKARQQAAADEQAAASARAGKLAAEQRTVAEIREASLHATQDTLRADAEEQTAELEQAELRREADALEKQAALAQRVAANLDAARKRA